MPLHLFVTAFIFFYKRVKNGMIYMKGNYDVYNFILGGNDICNV